VIGLLNFRFATLAFAGVLAANTLNAGLLLDTGLAPYTLAVATGVAAPVTVSTTTTLTNVAFDLWTPFNQSATVKYVIFDSTGDNVLFTSAEETVYQGTQGGAFVVSSPFSYTLMAGSTYYIGILANLSGNYLDGYSFSPAQTTTQNGLQAGIGIYKYSGYATPVRIGNYAQENLGLQLYGTTLRTNVTPEPATSGMIAAALLGLGVRYRSWAKGRGRA
jgi:hypothetical protein